MKIIYSFIFLLPMCIILFSCNDDNKEEVLSGDPLQIVASVSDTLILIESNKNDTVLTFTWNKGLDRPEQDTISYLFRMVIETLDFTDEASTPPDTIENFKKSYTALELNNLLIDKWEIIPGQIATIKARVVAKVDAPKFVYPEVSMVNVSIKTYIPTSSKE